jgi:hypothetical protein
MRSCETETQQMSCISITYHTTELCVCGKVYAVVEVKLHAPSVAVDEW